MAEQCCVSAFGAAMARTVGGVTDNGRLDKVASHSIMGILGLDQKGLT